MTYNDWVQLGFERVELNDLVEEQATGYGGYILEKKLTPFLNIYVNWDNLNEPFLQCDMFQNKDKVLRQYVAVDFAINLATLYTK